MTPKQKISLELVVLAVGTFSVATLANLAANKLSMEGKVHKKIGMVYASSGMLISAYLLYRINKVGVKTLM